MIEQNGNGKPPRIKDRYPFTPIISDPLPAPITSHTIYAAAVLQGVLANSDIMHDVEKTTNLAEKYADRMCERDKELGR